METTLAETYLSEADQLEAAADAPAQQSGEEVTQQLAANGAAAAQREDGGQQPGDGPLDAVCSGEAAVAVELAAVLRKWENSHRGAQFCYLGTGVCSHCSTIIKQCTLAGLPCCLAQISSIARSAQLLLQQTAIKPPRAQHARDVLF